MKTIAILLLALASAATPARAALPFGLFVPGTMSTTFRGLAELTYEYKAPVLEALADASFKLSGDRPELDKQTSPAWFMVLLAEPFVRDIQSQRFATFVIPKLDAAVARVRTEHGLTSLRGFPAHPAYQAAALRAFAAALAASVPFMTDEDDQRLAQSLLADCGRATALLDAGRGLDAGLRGRLGDDGARRLVQSLIGRPRTRGLGQMAALAQGYLSGS